LRHRIHHLGAWSLAAGLSALLAGCQANTSANAQTALPVRDTTGGFTAVDTTGHISSHGPLVRVLYRQMRPDETVVLVGDRMNSQASGEQVVDFNSLDGLVNYLTATFDSNRVHRAVVQDRGGHVIKTVYLSPRTVVSPSVNASSAAFAIGQLLSVPPPGVSMDHMIQARAGIGALPKDKADAVISVASSQEGAPFVWGHNKDRGQNGFDCGNFASYVYHHALGYLMSGNSDVQWDTVGQGVPIWDMRKGDLLLFDRGKHVGIYMGDDQMIQCGGGLGKVGVLSLGPDSYWGKHLSAVRRMY
jgi:hypothetical protein